MEGVEEKFSEAMEIVNRAVRADDPDECAKALRVFTAIQTDIQSVFDICLEDIGEVRVMLENLAPKIAEKIQEIKNRA
ncbi:Hypp3014 [Branchiostoma lanceolatum]|uniref:Hypp3014 protein n=1 Tax=Branchiostoma lanceolatum TaxID=7740 RepID=A0A8K0A0M7_BRALA|nr:Hypp3014 [Branchiostoma lanceolatum]